MDTNKTSDFHRQDTGSRRKILLEKGSRASTTRASVGDIIRVHSRLLSFICVNLRPSAVGMLCSCPFAIRFCLRDLCALLCKLLGLVNLYV